MTPQLLVLVLASTANVYLQASQFAENACAIYPKLFWLYQLGMAQFAEKYCCVAPNVVL